MIRRLSARIVANALGVTLIYTPLLGRMTATTAAAQTTQNTTVLYDYDQAGSLTGITDPLSRKTTLTADALNRVWRTVQPPAVSGGASTVTQYFFDGQDNVVKVTDPRYIDTNYTIDGIGNQTTLVSPDTGTTNRTFDLGGNVLTSTDARGKTTTFQYDVLNRLTRATYADGTASIYEYDGGASGAPTDIGHLTRMADESGQTIFAYDGMGRLLSKAQSTTAGATTVGLTLHYTYGTEGAALGKLASVTYPSGNRVNYSYDLAGRVASLVLNPANADGSTQVGTAIVLMSEIAYAPFGAVQAWKWGNHDPATHWNAYIRAFDLDGRLTSYPLGNPSRGAFYRSVNYDAAGRVTSIGHACMMCQVVPATFNQTYGYDDLDRLTSFVSSNATQNYAYDANGNRTQIRYGATAYGYGVSSSSNRLNSTGGPVPAKTNAFDLAGNLTGDGTAAYTYSDRGRLQHVLNAGVTTNYLYNGGGQRVAKFASGGVTYAYAYDEQGQLLGEYDGNGKPVQETVYLEGTPVAVLKTSTATDVYYVYADHINTPRVITTSTDDAVVWRWDGIDPFGQQQPNENPLGNGTFTYNPRFPGQLYDRESNHHYNYFRDYDPQTGRYVQSDPIGLNGGINTYAYVGGNPLSGIDPYGLQRVRPMPVPTAPPIPGADPYDPRIPSPGPRISDLFKPSPYLPTWDWPDWVYGAVGKPPGDAMDPNGAKAPGKPGGTEGFCEPKPGKPQWGKNPNGSGSGWVDADGNVWVPTGPDSGSTGDAHGGPHWDVQKPGGGYTNIYPGGKKR